MKPLSEMTREELWALDDCDLFYCEREYGITRSQEIQSEIDLAIAKQMTYIRQQLDKCRIELQQDRAAK